MYTVTCIRHMHTVRYIKHSQRKRLWTTTDMHILELESWLRRCPASAARLTSQRQSQMNHDLSKLMIPLLVYPTTLPQGVRALCVPMFWFAVYLPPAATVGRSLLMINFTTLPGRSVVYFSSFVLLLMIICEPDALMLTFSSSYSRMGINDAQTTYFH